MHETLDWAECEEEVKQFEKDKILKHVFDTELKEKSYPFTRFFRKYTNIKLFYLNQLDELDYD